MQQDVCFRDLGVKKYKEAWDYQETLLKENTDLKAVFRKMDISASEIPTKNYLLFVEHPPVYTLGKSGNSNHLLLNEETLSKRGIDFFHINRGGDITFHGPEQLVGYPILDLEKFKPDLGWYLRNLEEVIIQTLREFGIRGDRSPGETGVWLDPEIPGKERKICAMGIKCSRWISMHGFALNVNTDLNYFYDIVPCGIPDKQVTSIEKELGRKVEMESVKYLVKKNFEKIFECSLYAE